ncbi:MAG: hypothetical protein AAF570_11255 [Bacteroidota bacterium]
MFTALLTAFYMTRVYFLTFQGKERFPDTKHPHESDNYMTFPLIVLAGLAIVGGFIGLPAIIGHEVLHADIHALNGWLGGHGGRGGAVSMSHMHMVEHGVGLGVEVGLIIFSSAIAILGVWMSWSLFKKHDLAGDNILKQRLGKMHKWMEDKFYVDELYEAAIIKPFVFAGKHVIMAFDKWVIDGLVNGIGNTVLFLGDTLKLLQSGVVSQYAMMVVVGVVAIMTYLVFA